MARDVGLTTGLALLVAAPYMWLFLVADTEIRLIAGLVLLLLFSLGFALRSLGVGFRVVTGLIALCVAVIIIASSGWAASCASCDTHGLESDNRLTAWAVTTVLTAIAAIAAISTLTAGAIIGRRLQP